MPNLECFGETVYHPPTNTDTRYYGKFNCEDCRLTRVALGKKEEVIFKIAEYKAACPLLKKPTKK